MKGMWDFVLQEQLKKHYVEKLSELETNLAKVREQKETLAAGGHDAKVSETIWVVSIARALTSKGFVQPIPHFMVIRRLHVMVRPSVHRVGS
jgi:hypothetical protein